MGTRHLILVRSNNKIKVAQYGQWDGYLTGTLTLSIVYHGAKKYSNTNW